MTILALDISIRNTGWALWDGSDYHWGSKSFLDAKEDYGLLFSEYEKWIGNMIFRHDPYLIAMEGTYFGMKGKSAYQLNVLNGITHKVSYIADISRTEYAVSSIKKFITGNGRASKEEVIEAITNKGFEVDNDDEADALAVLSMALGSNSNYQQS